MAMKSIFIKRPCWIFNMKHGLCAEAEWNHGEGRISEVAGGGWRLLWVSVQVFCGHRQKWRRQVTVMHSQTDTFSWSCSFSTECVLDQGFDIASSFESNTPTFSVHSLFIARVMYVSNTGCNFHTFNSHYWEINREWLLSWKLRSSG